MQTITHYTLQPDEVHRVFEAGGPLAELRVGDTTGPADAERLKQMAIAVVEVDERIVAYWVTAYMLHVEPLWVVEEFRKHPAVIKGIVAEMQRIVLASREPAAFCTIDPENVAHVQPYAKRLGFLEAPGKVYYVIVDPPAEPVKG